MEINEIRPGRDLDHVHGEYASWSPEKVRETALARMQEYIDRGRTRAEHVVRSVMEQQPRDRYVPVRALRFGHGEQALRAIVGEDAPLAINQHALDQTAERAGLNLRFLHELQGRKEEWSNNLASLNLNQLLCHMPEKDRFLVRQVGDTVRGVLSSAYKRIDSRPTVDALIGAAMDAKAAVVEGVYSETRVSLKIVRAAPIEVFSGEWMVFGLDYSNSDYGDGAAEFAAFLLRLRCLNGAVSVHEFRKVHVGRRFSGDDAASERTLRLDAAAQASLARDQVRALLSDAATDNLVGQIRSANASEVAPKQIEGFLKARLGKEESKLVQDKFASADIVELPPGQTAWRLSNALSWLARETEDGRRKMQLERTAGEAMAVS